MPSSVCNLYLRGNAGGSHILNLHLAEGLWSKVESSISFLGQYIGLTTLSRRQKHDILYTFDIVFRSGLDIVLSNHLQGNSLRAEATRQLLLHCRKMLANMPEKGSFSPDAWEQLEVIRDELFILLESTLGQDDDIIEKLKMSSVEQERAEHLAWSMDQVLAMAERPASRPSFVCYIVNFGLRYIERTVSDLTSPK